LEVQNYETGNIRDNSREVRWMIHKIEFEQIAEFAGDLLVQVSLMGFSLLNFCLRESYYPVIIELH